MKKIVSYALMFAVAAYLLNWGMRLLREVWPWIAVIGLAVLVIVVCARIRRYNDSNKY
ncbi:MAG: hypothetical protein FWH26_11535 [Oscillospiraceae bacterium]|nr:hypothetical protein [Oscillospiraceae bacterium]